MWNTSDNPGVISSISISYDCMKSIEKCSGREFDSHINKFMRHKHHIIPRHMGGTDEPSNIVELTVAEHAEAHRLLYEQHRHKEDELAWKGLLGMIDKVEKIKMAQSIGGKNRMKKHSNPWRNSSGCFDVNPELLHRAVKLASNEASIAKKKKTFAENKHQQGQKNSQFGTCWVYHSEYGNKKIGKEELDKFLSLGYSKGRKMKTA